MILNSRIAISLASIAAAGALVVGGTFAFFSANDTSTNNILSTGTLNLNIQDQNADTAFQDETLGINWQPGEERLVNFDVKNTGSLPMNIRGFATGTWGFPELDSQNKVSVTKVEAWNGSGWSSLGIGPFTGYFYYSPSGTNTALYVVNGGDKAQLQLTVKLDETADNLFQGKTFTTTLQAEGRQTNDDTSWP